MELRVSFIGFNKVCARIARGLASIPEAGVVGILAHVIPAEWPSSLDAPPLFSSRREMFRAAKPNLLLVAEDVGELKGVPAKCQLVEVYDGAPVASLLEALPIMSSTDVLPQEEMEKIASLCAGVNVVEAYSNPMPKLAQLLDRAMVISGAELGMVLLPGEVLDELEVVLARGDEVQHIVGRGISVIGSLCGRAYDAGETIQGDLSRDIEEGRCLEDTEVGKLLAIPLRAEGSWFSI